MTRAMWPSLPPGGGSRRRPPIDTGALGEGWQRLTSGRNLILPLGAALVVPWSDHCLSAAPLYTHLRYGPVHLALTPGEAHDNRLCSVLLSALLPQTMLLADRGYDAD
jgi:hypothetical protein